MRIRADWRSRLDKIVEDRGGNRAALSRAAGLNPTYLRDVLSKDVTPSAASAQKLSDGLKVALTDWFIEQVGDTKINHPEGLLTAEKLGTRNELRDVTTLTHVSPGDSIDVLGSSEGGSDGQFPWNGQVVATVARPPFLVGATKGYGLYVAGESMAPRYHPGEIVYVHPGKPVTIGSYVVVQVLNPEDESTPLAFLKRLVRRTGKTVYFEQYNPRRIIEIPANTIVSMHKVVGGGEG